jgi:hypothetical protein
MPNSCAISEGVLNILTQLRNGFAIKKIIRIGKIISERIA